MHEAPFQKLLFLLIQLHNVLHGPWKAHQETALSQAHFHDKKTF